MTSPGSSRPRSLDDTVTSLQGPGELVAAVPVLLGFPPERSLVLIAVHGPRLRSVGLTLRADLPPPGVDPTAVSDVAAVAAGHLVEAAPPGPLGAAVVVVDPGGPARADVVDAVLAALAAAGVEAGTCVWAESTAAGARWGCFPPCGCAGTVPDPSSTPLAARAVAAGTVVRSSREELRRSVGPADVDRLRRRGLLLDSELDERARARDLAACLRTLDSALVAAADGRLQVDDELVLDMAVALQVPAVRDRALRECVGERAAAAEQLWAALARETPGPEAAEPAALLAVAALGRGDGALARIALERAQDAWPGHHLGAALDAALADGFGPDQVRAWLADAPW
ncbi:DUF4192 domain-containing protein [Pseudonocardia sp. D17]|uniref:DUF4192 domain-containing protein n=1 Tax=Pseudonocardia sp. D17 TaxID=882661 RepID=UPI002B3DF6CD|nr:hypothetical protein PSD17_18960 [Pseudonocardia sp. D17]